MPGSVVKFGFTYEQLINDGMPIDSAKIDAIQNWLIASDLPQLTNEQIVLFLLSCDDNVEFTKVTITAYFRIKYRGDDVFTNRKVIAEDVQKAFEVGSLCVWPEKTPEGYAIIHYSFKNSDYWRWDLRQASKIVFMAIECAVFDYPAQGLIVLLDLKKISVGHLLRLRPTSLKLLFDYFQEALPVKLKNIHVFNSSSLLNQLLVIVSPFINKELFEKICFHPKNIDWDAFYERHVPKRALSEDYGGDLPCCGVLEKRTIEKFVGMEEYFETEEASRLPKH